MVDITRMTAAGASAAAHSISRIRPGLQINFEGLDRALRKDDFVLLVATQDGHTAGYLHGALLHRPDGELMFLIYDVEVAEEHRRHGVATALVNQARRMSANRGAVETWLVTEDDNEEAQELYSYLGGKEFKAVGYEWEERELGGDESAGDGPVAWDS